MNRIEAVNQTKNAFDYIQKLYFEVSYLIKEVEGLLAQEEERFILARPSGYAVTIKKSTGLEPAYVNLWLARKLSVFYIPVKSTVHNGGITITKFEQNPKVIYMRVVLDDIGLEQPFIYVGVLDCFVKPGTSRFEKIEAFLTELEYNDSKVFQKENINYRSSNIEFMGRLFKVNLFDINSSQDVAEKLVAPVLKLFRCKT